MDDARRIRIARRIKTVFFTVGASLFIAFMLAVPALMWTGCASNAEADETSGTATATLHRDASVAHDDQFVSVRRGEYLVTIGGCNDCHTPLKMGPKGPEPDMSRMLSGHPENFIPENEPTFTKGWDGMVAASTGTAFSGGWGTSYAMNLTPDSLGGIGTWTREMFMKTIRTGKHWGAGRPINPPMPWFNYAKMTDDDLNSVYEYLRAIPPVRNTPPAYRPPSKALATK